MPPHQNPSPFVESKEILKKSNKHQRFDSEREKYKFLIWEFQTHIIWKSAINLIVLHILTVYFLLTHPYLEKPGLFVYFVIVTLINGFGVTGAAHRYFTHRTYKAKLPLRLILLFCYSVTGQNTIYDWVRDHRVHHKFSETDADPHDSRRGFFFSHVGWLMMRKRPEVIIKGQQIDCSDIFEDPLVVFHQRYFVWIKLLCCFILPTIIPPLLWGESWLVSIKMIAIVRYVMALNYTWSVNSAAHLWGNKPYDKKIFPVENIAVSLVALGEGYHNYHHTFPWDYRAAEIGTFWNYTTLVLNFFEKIGWAYDLKSTPSELVRRMVENHGDASHYKWGHEVTEEKARMLMKET